MNQQLIQFITNHWSLCAALLGILILIALNEFISQKTSPKLLSTSAVVDHMNQNKTTIIDVRPEDAFSTGHILHAVRISGGDAKRFEQYKTKPFILVCARGIESKTLAMKLRKQGFGNPMILNGGMNAWQTAGLPVVKGKK
jgi:rhodanese-related sulfurtransferase